MITHCLSLPIVFGMSKPGDKRLSRQSVDPRVGSAKQEGRGTSWLEKWLVVLGVIHRRMLRSARPKNVGAGRHQILERMVTGGQRKYVRAGYLPTRAPAMWFSSWAFCELRVEPRVSRPARAYILQFPCQLSFRACCKTQDRSPKARL
jgi:hypothetical protein